MALRCQRIVSVTARMERYSGNREPRKTTGHSKHNSLQPCFRERLLQCIRSAPAGKSFPAKLLHFSSSSAESVTNSVGQGKVYPIKKCYSTVLLQKKKKKGLNQTSFKRFIGRKEPRRVAALCQYFCSGIG